MPQAIGIPIVFAALVLGVLGTVSFISRNYIKCAPNEVLVLYGRTHRIQTAHGEVKRGYRLITGGAAFRIPILEQVHKLSLNIFQVQFSVEDTPNTDGVLVTVEAVANMKVSSDPGTLDAAVERLLGKQHTELVSLAITTLSGQLRQIVGTLSIEEIVQNREKISQQVLAVTQAEINKIGLSIDNFVITKITDKEGYIEALGKKRTAEVKRDAAIGEAEAARESTIKSSTARKEGEQKRLENEALIAQSERDLAVKEAEFKVETERAQAKAELARAVQTAEIRQDLVKKEVAVEQAQITARIAVAEQEAARKEKELIATLLKPAEAERESSVIRADGEAKSSVRKAEGEREATIARATAEKMRLAAEGEGHAAAEAAQKKQIGEAEASAIRARGEAEAAATQARLVAEAEGIKASRLAEALGFQKKNEALAQMSDAARMVIVLELLPGIIEKGGEAGQKVLASAFEHIGAGLSKIDNLTMVDLGNGAGSGPVTRFALSVPDIVFGVVQKARAMGIDVNDILKKLGIDVSQIAGAGSSSGAKAGEELQAAGEA